MTFAYPLPEQKTISMAIKSEVQLGMRKRSDR